MQETPLDDSYEPGGSSGKIDPNVISSVVQEVMKALEKRTSTSNFASKAFSLFKNDMKNVWIVDTGASDHMTRCKQLLIDITPLIIPIKIGLLDRSLKTVTQVSNVHVLPKMILKNVLYVPDFKHNLMSVSRLLDENHLRIEFDSKGCVMQDPITDQVIALGSVQDGVYKLEKVKGTLEGNEEKGTTCSLER